MPAHQKMWAACPDTWSSPRPWPIQPMRRMPICCAGMAPSSTQPDSTPRLPSSSCEKFDCSHTSPPPTRLRLGRVRVRVKRLLCCPLPTQYHRAHDIDHALELVTLNWVHWSIIIDCSSRSETSRPQKPKQLTIGNTKSWPWRPDSNQRVSGIAGAFHSQHRRRLGVRVKTLTPAVR